MIEQSSKSNKSRFLFKSLGEEALTSKLGIQMVSVKETWYHVMVGEWNQATLSIISKSEVHLPFTDFDYTDGKVAFLLPKSFTLVGHVKENQLSFAKRMI